MVIQVLPIQTGMGRKGQWQKQEFILEIPSGQYKTKVAMSAWGDKIDEFDLYVGKDITAFINLESREYNGRWYTEVRVWKIESSGGLPPNAERAKAPEPMTKPFVSDGPTDESDNLPF